MSGERGSGAGKGGGSGGAIRDAGGSFGKMEAAHEDQYFYNLVSIFSLFFKRSLHYSFICLLYKFKNFISAKRTITKDEREPSR